MGRNDIKRVFIKILLFFCFLNSTQKKIREREILTLKQKNNILVSYIISSHTILELY